MAIKEMKIEIYYTGSSIALRVSDRVYVKFEKKGINLPILLDRHPASRHLVRSELKAIAPQRTDTTKGTF